MLTWAQWHNEFKERIRGKSLEEYALVNKEPTTNDNPSTFLLNNTEGTVHNKLKEKLPYGDKFTRKNPGTIRIYYQKYKWNHGPGGLIHIYGANKEV